MAWKSLEPLKENYWKCLWIEVLNCLLHSFFIAQSVHINLFNSYSFRVHVQKNCYYWLHPKFLNWFEFETWPKKLILCEWFIYSSVIQYDSIKCIYFVCTLQCYIVDVPCWKCCIGNKCICYTRKNVPNPTLASFVIHTN